MPANKHARVHHHPTVRPQCSLLVHSPLPVCAAKQPTPLLSAQDGERQLTALFTFVAREMLTNAPHPVPPLQPRSKQVCGTGCCLCWGRHTHAVAECGMPQRAPACGLRCQCCACPSCAVCASTPILPGAAHCGPCHARATLCSVSATARLLAPLRVGTVVVKLT